MKFLRKMFRRFWNQVLIQAPKFEDLPKQEQLKVLYERFKREKRRERADAMGIPAHYRNRLFHRYDEDEPKDLTVGDAVKNTAVAIVAIAVVLLECFLFYVGAWFVIGIWAKFGIIAIG